MEKILPEALPAIRRQSIAVRVLFLAAILVVPIVGVIVWAPLMTLLGQGATVEVPFRLLTAAAALGAVAIVGVWLAVARFRRRSRLVSFVQQWVEFRSRFELLHIRIDGWLLLKKGGTDDPQFTEVTDGIQDYFSRRIPLRRLLFLLGEESLVAKDSQHWLELKRAQPIFRERDYLTPFAFLLDLGAPIASINDHGKAIWAALFVADEYIEYLTYRYPFLKRVANSKAAGCAVTEGFTAWQ